MYHVLSQLRSNDRRQGRFLPQLRQSCEQFRQCGSARLLRLQSAPCLQRQRLPTPIRKRSIVTCILLSIVTCGIYGIYWTVCLVNDLNTASGTPQDTSGGVVFLLSLVTCGIYMYYWMYKAGEKVSVIQRRQGRMNSENNGLLYLLLSIFGLSIVSYCLIQSELNQVASF